MKYALSVVGIVMALGAYYFYTNSAQKAKNAGPAEEKVVHENVVSNQKDTPVALLSSMIVDPKIAKVGDRVGDFVISEINNKDAEIIDDQSLNIQFTGTITVTGIVQADELFGPVLLLSDVEAQKIPRIKGFNDTDQTTQFVISGKEEEKLPEDVVVYKNGRNSKYELTAVIKDYNFRFAPEESSPVAELVHIVSLRKVGQ